MSGRDDRNLRAAVAYAKAGWRVFPCVPGEKVPATAHGVKDATSDPRQIAKWWERNPDRNVAIACGHPGPDVLDVDRKPDGSSGFPALRQLREAGLVGIARALIRTPNDGAHLYFAPTPGSGNGSVPAAHIDHRGEGGYVVAPPSEVRRAADGQPRPYVVVHHQASADRINWPAIRAHLEPQRERQWEPPAHLRGGGQQNLDHLVQHMAGLDDGRKRYLYWAANRVLDHNQPERLANLAAAARAAGSDPRQIERTIDSARQQQRQDPHAQVPQPRESVRVAIPRGPSRPDPGPAEPRREPEAQAARPAEPQPEARGRVAVLEVDRDGPEVPERSQKPTSEPEAEPTEQPAAAAASPEPERGREHQADAEPGAAARPFDPEPEPEREAGE